jgi:hypothetical protein
MKGLPVRLNIETLGWCENRSEHYGKEKSPYQEASLGFPFSYPTTLFTVIKANKNIYKI